MSAQKEIIEEFCKGASFYMVKFDSKDDQEFGKILKNEELAHINLNVNEIHRSISFKDGNMLFSFNLLPTEKNNIVMNPLELLISNLSDARAIEAVYPDIFRWAFDGVSVKGYAIVPSGDGKANSTITRYGGTEMFIKILKQHLRNIAKLHNGLIPDFGFLQSTEKIGDTDLSLASINMFNSMYSVGINLDMSYSEVINASKYNIQEWKDLNTLDMKYWAKEVNPDFIAEAKHIKLKHSLPIDWTQQHYPPCIKQLARLQKKGNYNRYLLTRFLLSVHIPKDAKFVYKTLMADEELQHIQQGNCSTQWNYILNNIKRYDCPTCSQLRTFCDKECKLAHPLENIQKAIEDEETGDRKRTESQE